MYGIGQKHVDPAMNNKLTPSSINCLENTLKNINSLLICNSSNKKAESRKKIASKHWNKEERFMRNSL